MNILALDVATKTGWCTKTSHGTWDFKIKRDESSGMRLIRFKAKILELLKLENINVVVFERSAGRHASSVIVQSELHGVLKSICEENNIQYKAYSAKEIKSYATGNGNASKTAMIKKAQEKLDSSVEDDNEADAMWLYQLAKEDLNG